jgi:hypothetical protein
LATKLGNLVAKFEVGSQVTKLKNKNFHNDTSRHVLQHVFFATKNEHPLIVHPRSFMATNADTTNPTRIIDDEDMYGPGDAIPDFRAIAGH